MNGLVYFKPSGLVLSSKSVSPSIAPGSPSAGYPSVSSSRLWLDRNRNVFSDTAGTTPASAGGTVGSWGAVGGGWGTDLLTQPVGSRQPTIQSNGFQCDGTDDRLLLPSSITLSGNWTMYVVSSRSVVSDAVEWANDNSTAVLGNFGSSQFYWFPTAGAPYTDAVTAKCIRRFRSNGTNGILKIPGSAEQSVAIAGANIVWDRIFGRTSESNSSGVRFHQLVFVQKTITPDDADDVAIRTKLLGLESGTTDLT